MAFAGTGRDKPTPELSGYEYDLNAQMPQCYVATIHKAAKNSTYKVSRHAGHCGSCSPIIYGIKKGDPISRVALTFRGAHYRWVSLCNAHPRAQDCGTARGQRGNEPSAFQDPSQTSEGHDCQVGGMKQPL